MSKREEIKGNQKFDELKFGIVYTEVLGWLDMGHAGVHEFPVPGKIQVSPTKPLATQRDLALAYSPGVAAPCLEIEKDP
ncbi:hypothetical protein MJN51_37605, partial [Salmonella enterica subsp. enterica serovar Kentucky]|nr:hypothetical protein [Salmonella enterica subsp. enterica serovar Kentucky]